MHSVKSVWDGIKKKQRFLPKPYPTIKVGERAPSCTRYPANIERFPERQTASTKMANGMYGLYPVLTLERSEEGRLSFDMRRLVRHTLSKQPEP